MKNYQQPQLELVRMDTADVIATSGLREDKSFDAGGNDLFSVLNLPMA
jgi:hypothetical protein